MSAKEFKTLETFSNLVKSFLLAVNLCNQTNELILLVIRITDSLLKLIQHNYNNMNIIIVVIKIKIMCVLLLISLSLSHYNCKCDTTFE